MRASKGVAVVVGTRSAGFLGEAVGIVPIIAFQGVAYMAAGVVILLVLRHDVRAPAASQAGTATA
jgi:hypothetical protein